MYYKNLLPVYNIFGGGVQAFFLAIGKFYKAEIFVERIKFQEMREAITHNRSWKIVGKLWIIAKLMQKIR